MYWVYILYIYSHCSSVSIADFEQVIIQVPAHMTFFALLVDQHLRMQFSCGQSYEMQILVDIQQSSMFKI